MPFKNLTSEVSNFGASCVAVALLFLLSATAFAQNETVAQNQAATTVRDVKKQTAPQPALNDIRGITIGMTADEVKDKLGKAKTADKTGFFYRFSDEESLQITLDSNKKVRSVVTYYIGEGAESPKYADVFGADVPLKTRPNGKIYNLVKYRDAGYWVSYSRIMVDNGPMITVTMKKMN